MVRYDWLVLRKLSTADILKVIKALANIKSIGCKSELTMKTISKFKDTSAFLARPTRFLENCAKYSENELYFYLELAAYRSYITYKLYNTVSLNLNVLPDIYNLKALGANRLLDITNDTLHFKYEE